MEPNARRSPHVNLRRHLANLDTAAPGINRFVYERNKPISILSIDAGENVKERLNNQVTRWIAQLESSLCGGSVERLSATNPSATEFATLDLGKAQLAAKFLVDQITATREFWDARLTDLRL